MGLKYNSSRKWWIGCRVILPQNIHLNRDMRFPTIWHFDKYRLGRACVASFLSLETPKGVQSVA